MTQWGLDTLFNPAKRHMDEEKRRLQSTREEVGDSSGGKRIDLESGKVTMRRPADDAPPEDGATEYADAADQQQNEPGATRRSKKELSPAAIRAARRRGREPR
jgi:hypothetical protein